jgi:hypothetical protein
MGTKYGVRCQAGDSIVERGRCRVGLSGCLINMQLELPLGRKREP